jgi:hypothetical protein
LNPALKRLVKDRGNTHFLITDANKHAAKVSKLCMIGSN